MKVSGKRVSKNIQFQDKKNSTEADTAERGLRQIFDPVFSGKLTKVSNRMANADRLANKGKGAVAMKSVANKAPSTKFLPFETKTYKQTKAKKNG